jgi:hypothetical protein
MKLSAFIKEHPELQNIKFLNFVLFLWVIFTLLDPDPDPLTRWNLNSIRIQSTASRMWNIMAAMPKNEYASAFKGNY